MNETIKSFEIRKVTNGYIVVPTGDGRSMPFSDVNVFETFENAVKFLKEKLEGKKR